MHRYALIILLAAVGACGDVRGGSISAVVRDSANIRIVENSAAQSGAADGWRVGTIPTLQIGSILNASEYEFRYIISAGRLSDGRLFAVDRDLRRISYYTDRGDFISSIGRHGDGPGEFRSIENAEVGAGDTLYIFDASHRRVTVLSPEGEHVRDARLLPELDGPFARAWPRPDGGWLGIVQTRPTREPSPHNLVPGTIHLLRFDADGKQEGILLSVPGDDWVITGRGVTFPQYGYQPSAVVVDTVIYFGISRDFEIGRFDGDGTLRTIVRRTGLDLSLTDAEIEAAYRTLGGRFYEGASLEEFVRDRLTFPRAQSRPPFGRIRLDSEGNLWVGEHTPGGGEIKVWTIFSPEGEMLGDIELPDRFAPLSISRDEVLGRWADELDVQYLASFPIIRP